MPELKPQKADTLLAQALQQVGQQLEHSCLRQAAAPGCVLPPALPRTLYPLRLFEIRQFQYSAESLNERLVSLYDAVSHLADSCFLLLEGREDGVRLCLGLRAQAPGAAAELFRAGLEGNFPGIVMKELDSGEIDRTMSRLEEDTDRTVSAVTLRPSERGSEEEERNVQGLEKFIDTMMGKNYTAIILAVPYREETVLKRITALENIATLLSPYAEGTMQVSDAQAVNFSDSVNSSVAESIARNLSVAYSDTQTRSTFRQSAKGKNHGLSPLGLGIGWNSQSGWGSGTADTSGKTTTDGTSVGQTTTGGTAHMEGASRTRTLNCGIRWKNKQVEDLLKQIDRQIQRLHAGGSYFDCCAYFVAKDPADSVIAARAFQALACGRRTENNALCTVWQTMPGCDQSSNIRNLLDCLHFAEPPRFYLPDGRVCSTDSAMPGSELPRMMGLPRSSVPGLTVTRAAAFGRSVSYAADRLQPPTGRQMTLGSIVHMGKVTPQPVRLELDRLCAHGLIVGASGSGKTTVTCGLLNSLIEQKIGFTVVEPVKGEYKYRFGQLPGVRIFTVSARPYRMLRLNPFAFDPEVHVLDHIDRLIDTFSVCWPLYAAQPALLRDCVSRAYTERGWDLANSVCRAGAKDPFPTFRDLLRLLPEVIRENHLVGETRGSYEGTLRTRLNMLVSGVFGEVFCSGINVSDQELFEGCTILDFSQVGSSETRSLLMAVIISRLYEYRMAHPTGGRGLHHLTLLEEAHNVLRGAPPASAAGEEGVTAKAVENAAQSIAELRFRGEGFWVVDQSPSVLDKTVIKNTATKIALRLPHEEDQNAIAKAMNLSDEQAAQLARLPDGTSAVLQEGWTEPVLVKGRRCAEPWKTGENDHVFSYRKLCRLRSFLLRNVLAQYRLRQFDGAALQTLLTRNIRGLERQQQDAFREMFAYYQSRYLRMQKWFADPEYSLPFYGELIRTLLACEGLFTLCVPPRPEKGMQLPYSRDAAYQEHCRKWQKEARETLDLYTAGLTEQERDETLRCLLLFYGQTDTTGLLVSSVLYPAAPRGAK